MNFRICYGFQHVPKAIAFGLNSIQILVYFIALCHR